VIGESIVVDAVVHPYNLAASNQNSAAQPQLDAVYAAHVLATDEAHSEYTLKREEFFTDFSFDAMASALFLESPTDFAFIHALPNLGFALDDVTSPRRAAAFRDAHPTRFAMYATVDTPVTDAAIKQLAAQVDEFGVDGLKLYPAFFYDGIGEGWRLDSHDFAVPLLEAARDLGIRNVAVHKALWLPPAPKDCFRIDDVDPVLRLFPDLNFSIVHAGVAFCDQTVALLANHSNLYATLESLFAYVLVKPRVFAEVLGAMIHGAGSERLMYGSGVNLMHPLPMLEEFQRFRMPADLMAERGYRDIDATDRANILGENVLRMHGMDGSAILTATRDDEYDRARGDGFAAPWSLLRRTVTGR
jgi:predicted TIM-barrel fold metal-dependent hydrolase